MKKFLFSLSVIMGLNVGAKALPPIENYTLTRAHFLALFDSKDRTFEFKGKKYHITFDMSRENLEKLDPEGKFEFSPTLNMSIYDLRLFEAGGLDRWVQGVGAMQIGVIEPIDGKA